ncbi:right-handed parallel beta-helix repeat-containing protein [Nostoc sp. FACHB-152]|uniref:right-handed parallel beta-helix repeat-containing protein n=1 Tax=unclassified Nostoc TaxID=2593658 RepID=UPI001686D338|nr:MULTISPECIES: right-handed parallel beta-helix repeat-containing protein [unclassified Nostoc]MBD2445800.1 right-handed parallel beta-helix repeat-containing protein [Nostoc sp. FACHB-152]MBD2466914.1 right-handed parallel beta-helix repeat-containing protein [Nostoc sp. FACHB-145]
MSKLRVFFFSISFGIFVSLDISRNDRSYFVSPNGSDKNPGTIEYPFKTIQKCANIVQPGQTCWLRGGIYRETIRPLSSGINSNLITFAAYENENVTISGTELVEKWSVYRNSIFRSKMALPVDAYSDTIFFANQVFVDGEMMPEARLPNLDEKRDFLSPTFLSNGVKSHGGTAASVENSKIPSLSEGWAGAKVWTNEWYTTRTGTITGGTAGKLTAQMDAPWDRGGFWFYLFGKLELLDSPGEWFYDHSRQILYLWSPDSKIPSGVEVKQRNFAFDLSDRSYISLHNLNLFANTITTSDRSTGIVIDGIQAKYVSHHMTLPPLPQSEKAYDSDNALFLASHTHDTGIQLRGTGHTLKNSIIEWSSGNGVLLEGKNHLITNNIIANSNYMVSYAAPVRINGSGHKITHNTIVRAGRDAINIDWHTAGTDARNIEIAYNDISRFGMLSTDLGAIYVCCHVNLAGGVIHHNWIRDAQAFSPFWGTRGIYLDIESFNSTIHHNVIWGITGGTDSLSLTAGGPRGYHKVFNNTFLGAVGTDKFVEVRNNIFAVSESVDAAEKSHNLFMDKDPRFSQVPTQASQSIPDFTLQSDSPAVDAGAIIPGITDDFVGKAPDIGAYERSASIWKAGSTLNYTLKENNSINKVKQKN